MSQNSDSSQGRTWGNGRKLSSDQMRRKRNDDRIAKQRKREKARELQVQNQELTKRVFELETKIKELESRPVYEEPINEKLSAKSCMSLSLPGNLRLQPKADTIGIIVC
jgi:hypothetical protein